MTIERAAEVKRAGDLICRCMEDMDDPYDIAQALSDAGLLAGGIPTLEQIARAIDPDAWEHVDACHAAMKVSSEEQLKVLRRVIDHRPRHSGSIPAAERVAALFTIPLPPAEG